MQKSAAQLQNRLENDGDEESQSIVEFDFEKNSNTDDRIAVECRDVLVEMIGSIEYAGNEMNFTKQDPCIDYYPKNIPGSAIKEEEEVAHKKKEKSCKTM